MARAELLGNHRSVYYVSDRFNGCAASHDLIRIVPKDPRMAGYLYGYISSAIAQVMIKAHTFGSQLDRINEKQLGRLLVPIATTEEMRYMHDRVVSAFDEFERASYGLSKVINDLHTILSIPVR